MSYLLDTNVISEIRKGERANRSVLDWYASVSAESLFLSVLVIGEIRRGCEILRRRDAERAAVLDRWLAALVKGFGSRILPVDSRVTDRWARLTAARSVPVVDGLLAATADVHDLVLVTRNHADIAGLGVPFLDPFEWSA